MIVFNTRVNVYSQGNRSAVSCLVVPAFICIDLLISLVLKINDDDDGGDDPARTRLRSASSYNYFVPRTRTKFCSGRPSRIEQFTSRQQFAKRTACIIRLSASSKLICSLCFNEFYTLSFLCILQTSVMHSRSGAVQGGHNNRHLLT